MKKPYTHLIIAIVFAVVYWPTFAQPVADFIVTGNPHKCKNVNYQFTNMSTGAITYVWDFGDGTNSTVANPIHAYANAGTYIVKLTAINGVNTSVKKVAVFVKPNPSAYFNVLMYNDKYPGDEVSFENYSTHAYNALWNFGDGTTSTNKYNVRHTYNTPGNKLVSLTVDNNCGATNTFSTSITILDSANLDPQAYISGYRTLVCPGEEITFSHYCRFYTSIKWDFGDGTTLISNQQEVKHIYNNKGIYNLKLYAYRNTKVDSTDLTIYVTDTAMDMPYASVTPFRVVNGNYLNANCVGLPFRLQGFLYYTNQRGYWRFSNGVVINANDTSYAFNSVGTYQAWYVVTNSCGVKDSVAYELHVLPSDTFTSSAIIGVFPYNATVCPGNKMYFYTYSDNEDGRNFIWKINDTIVSSGREYTHTFPNYAGTFNVKVIRNFDCGKSDSTAITVYTSNTVLPPTSFTLDEGTSETAPNCYKDTVYFSTSYDSEYRLNTYSHFWDFGDGTTSTLSDPVKVYSNPGWHSIIHRVTNTCNNSAEEALTFYTTSDIPPNIRFYAYPDRICAGDSTMIDNFTWDADSTVIDYGDGQRKIIKGIGMPHEYHRYTAPGVYTLRVYAYNKCSGDTGKLRITVLAGPNSYINMNDTTIDVGTTLTITRVAGNAIRHVWFRSQNIADTSTANAFTCTFNTAGVYKVYLLSFNEAGCSKLDSVTINVQQPSSVAQIAGEKAIVKVYPNPTQFNYTFELKLENNSDVSIQLFDLNGKHVATLLNDKLNAGEHAFDSNVSNLPNGIYFCRISVNGSVTHQKLIKQQ